MTRENLYKMIASDGDYHALISIRIEAGLTNPPSNEASKAMFGDMYKQIRKALEGYEELVELARTVVTTTDIELLLNRDLFEESYYLKFKDMEREKHPLYMKARKQLKKKSRVSKYYLRSANSNL